MRLVESQARFLGALHAARDNLRQVEELIAKHQTEHSRLAKRIESLETSVSVIDSALAFQLNNTYAVDEDGNLLDSAIGTLSDAEGDFVGRFFGT